MLANTGADFVTVKRASRWQSSSVAESYIGNSMANKIIVSNYILSVEEKDDENLN